MFLFLKTVFFFICGFSAKVTFAFLAYMKQFRNEKILTLFSNQEFHFFNNTWTIN